LKYRKTDGEYICTGSIYRQGEMKFEEEANDNQEDLTKKVKTTVTKTKNKKQEKTNTSQDGHHGENRTSSFSM